MTPAPARPAPPSWRTRRALAGNGVRVVLIAALVLAPLLYGAFFSWVFGPLHAVAYASGLLLLWRSRRLQAMGGQVPPLPAGRALVAFAALVVFQLVPLPPRLLRLVSPGTFEFHERQMLVPLTSWKPISVSPADTFFGLVYLVGMAFLYLAVSRAFAGPWRRWLMRTVIYVGMFMTFVALVQKASGAEKIYGIMGINDSWAAFGPYFSRSHFAGYLPCPSASPSASPRRTSPSCSARGRGGAWAGWPWGTRWGARSSDGAPRPWSSSSASWPRPRAAPSWGSSSCCSCSRPSRGESCSSPGSRRWPSWVWLDRPRRHRPGLRLSWPRGQPSRALARRAAHASGLPALRGGL